MMPLFMEVRIPLQIRMRQEQQQDLALSLIERPFFYMPMMHSEDRAVQERSVETFQRFAEEASTESELIRQSLQANYEYAVRHAEIVARFGRYPHRNAILGRASTEEELEFLKQPGSSF